MPYEGPMQQVGTLESATIAPPSTIRPDPVHVMAPMASREFKISIGGPHTHLLRIEEMLLDRFGGFTRTIGEGGYVALNGDRIVERATIYTVGTSASKPDVKRLALDVAREAYETLDQESIYLFDSGCFLAYGRTQQIEAV